MCVISTIDEYDNLILEIAGLGRCTTEMLNQCIGPKINKVKIITTDSASTYQEFCSSYNIKLQTIRLVFIVMVILILQKLMGYILN